MIEQSLFTLEDQKYVALLDLQRQLADRRLPVGGSRLTHVLVDEFQDINPLDLALIKAILQINKSDLTIVGDDDQAIFEWRGASPNYILTPEVHFGRPFDTYILERNYRCPRNLVEASQRLIVRNSRRHPKRVDPVNPATAEVTVIRRQNFTNSIDSVMDEVRNFLSDHSVPARMAIVSRKRAQLIPYQILMAGENLPFYAAEDLQVFLSTAFENLRKMLQVCAIAKGPQRPFSLIDDVTGLCNQVKRYPLKKAERDGVAAHLRAARPRGYEDAINALASYQAPSRAPTTTEA